MMRLVIISHTEHYKLEDGSLAGLGSTVTEINHLLEVFDEIVHLGMLHKGEVPASALPYVSNRIHFVPLPTVGGKSLLAKSKILWNTPKTLWLVNKYLKGTDFFQFRAPTGIGVFVIPYLIFFSKKKGWFKYAGNWKPKGAPLAYRFQKWLLLNQNRKVTINGVWEDQSSHCLSFENPCLTNDELKAGEAVLGTKKYIQNELEFCFVGRVETAKGIDLFIEAFGLLNSQEKVFVKAIHIVGSGSQISHFKNLASTTGLPFIFYGSQQRHEVHSIYKRSHFLILPSVSEGFPKVVSEAMNYGCVPVITSIPTISLYIKDGQNGYLLKLLTSNALCHFIQNLLHLTANDYYILMQQCRKDIHRFTYGYYNQRIREKILKS